MTIPPIDAIVPATPLAKRLRRVLNLACVLTTAVATSCAAYFTGIQAQLLLKTGERQIRAYMNMSVDEIPTGRNDDKNIFVTLSLKNYGVTPAYHIKSYFHVDPERRTAKELSDLLKIHEGVFHLGTNQAFSYQIRLNMTFDDYNSLAKAGGKRYIYATIKYEDVFRNLHYSNFCLQLKARTDIARLVPCDFFDDFD